MRILIGADTYAPNVNGASYFAQRLAASLASSHEVHVVCPALDFRNSVVRKLDGVTEHRVRSLPVLRRRGYRFCPPGGLSAHVGRVLDDVAPDVVHVQSHFPVCRALIQEARRRGIPVIATNHFMPENLTHYVPVVGRHLHDWAWRDAARVLNEADVVTAPTPYAAALAMGAGVRGPVLPISCGIDLARFPAGLPATPFRERHGLDSRPVITYVGRLDVEKNLDVVIRAFAALGLPAQLLLVGVGAERGRLEALATWLGVSVTFAGFVADCDLPAAYAATDIFVNAGTAELQSLVTLEAMASGKPVVGADASALPHLVIDGVTGYLFSPGDPGALAERLRRMLSDPASVGRMGAAARRLAEQHDQKLTTAAFERLYEAGTTKVSHSTSGAARQTTPV